MVRSKGSIALGALALAFVGMTSGCTAKLDPADKAAIENAVSKAEAAANKADMAARSAAEAAQRADAAAMKAEAIFSKGLHK